MKRPSFNEKTEVKVISHVVCKETFDDPFGWRGTVTSIVGFKEHPDREGHERYEQLTAPYSPDNYPDFWIVSVKFDDKDVTIEFSDWETQLEAVQKKFIDIDHLRETDIDLGIVSEDGTHAVRPSNAHAFAEGDVIQITTKIDGANASFAWDKTTQKLEIFSRTRLLDKPDDLHGFVAYVKANIEPKIDWSDPIFYDLVFFGEWLVPHTVKYNQDAYHKFYIYDIWNKNDDRYMPQQIVKEFCDKYEFEYVEVLYEGPFVSWEHCRSFIGKSERYGAEQEGVVVKNQSKLFRDDIRYPKYIKIVDEKFKEAQHSTKPPRQIDVAKEAEKAAAYRLIGAVVTKGRVMKHILKLVDDGLLPTELKPTDIGTCMKHLPKAVFDDIIKEENETVIAAGEYAGKACSATVSKLVKEIVLGR